MQPTSTPIEEPGKARPASTQWWAGVRQSAYLILSLAITGVALWVLLWEPFKSSSAKDKGDGAAANVPAKVAGPKLVFLQPDSVLGKKLGEPFTATAQKIDTPVLTVTGSVVARLSPGKDSPEARWDFTTSELASAYADWLKARADEVFTGTQLGTIRELTAERVKAQTIVVDRLVKLVAAGTDAEKDLTTARADLVQARLQAQKDVHEAETALKNANRTRATLERQLLQAGVDPVLLETKSERRAIVVADVPEARVGLVEKDQACRAVFFAFPKETFKGKVGSLAPILNKERRTLRVFFDLEDPESRLKPGMFAEVGLNSAPRRVLLVPGDAVLHVGRGDYVLVQDGADTWGVTEVSAGEAHGTMVEILGGLPEGSKVIGAGAILLKPLVDKALQQK